jgi:thiol:disulfide interchange protein
MHIAPFRPRCGRLLAAVSALLAVLAPVVVAAPPDGGLPGGAGAFDPLASITAALGSPVRVDARLEAGAAGPVLVVTATLEEGWHLYSVDQKPGGPQATRISVAADSPLRPAGPFRPDVPPERRTIRDVPGWEGLVVEEHSGTVTWRALLARNPAGTATEVLGGVSLQLCRENACTPPETKPFNAGPVTAALAAAAAALPSAVDGSPSTSASAGAAMSAALAAGGGAAEPAARSLSLPVALLMGLVGGLILNLMPCVFPVLGLKILGFVEQAGNQRARVAAHGLVFTAGVLVSFWTLAGVLVALRAGGDQLGWGFQLQSAPFVYGLAILLLVFALNLSGLFEFGLAATAVGGELQARGGYGGSFFTGVLATVVATPCSAPFLAPALGAALTVPPVQSFLLFTAIGVGLSGPYLLFSVFPDLVRVLPRPGAWMETFKQLMAFPLYGTVGYLVWVLAAQTSEEGFLHLLLSLVVVAFAVWLYGRWTAPEARPRRPRAAVVAVVVGGALALWLGWPRAVPAPGAGAADVTWEAWSPEAVERLRAEGRVIYVDFTARWCATCQTNKRLVFGSAEVRRVFAERRIATLRADWTNRDPRITAELARYQRSAVPFNVIWQPGRAEPVILPELLTPGIVLNALGR